MKYKWLNKKNNKKLIIFFNGWGMDESIVKHLNPEDFDILMFYDYNNLKTDFDFNLLNNYSKKNLIAWSMGVMVATCFSPSLVLHLVDGTSTAINGTLKPIDPEFGIHPKIYDLTIKGFNEKGRKRFIDSMFNKTIDINCNREIDEQHSELIALKNYKTDKTIEYNKILISDNDKIIPTKSQVSFWGIQPNLKGGHCPFFQFKKWSELL
jgi:biotin synthesis protein BioG